MTSLPGEMNPWLEEEDAFTPLALLLLLLLLLLLSAV